VITDRDIALYGYASGLPSDAPVRDAMTRGVVTISETKTLEDALVLMEAQQVRRLVVCDDLGKLVGVFSVVDATMICNGDGRVTNLVRALASRNGRILNLSIEYS